MAKRQLLSVAEFQTTEQTEKKGAATRIIGRLEITRLCCAKPAIDALIRESTHMVFSLQSGCEATPAGELGIRSIFKVYVAFP